MSVEGHLNQQMYLEQAMPGGYRKLAIILYQKDNNAPLRTYNIKLNWRSTSVFQPVVDFGCGFGERHKKVQ